MTDNLADLMIRQHLAYLEACQSFVTSAQEFGKVISEPGTTFEDQCTRMAAVVEANRALGKACEKEFRNRIERFGTAIEESQKRLEQIQKDAGKALDPKTQSAIIMETAEHLMAQIEHVKASAAKSAEIQRIALSDLADAVAGKEDNLKPD